MITQTIGVKFSPSSKIYHYFIPKEAVYEVGDRIKIESPHGVCDVTVAEVNVPQDCSRATVMLPSIEEYWNFKCRYLRENGASGMLYTYYTTKPIPQEWERQWIGLSPNNKIVRIDAIKKSNYKYSLYKKALFPIWGIQTERAFTEIVKGTKPDHLLQLSSALKRSFIFDHEDTRKKYIDIVQRFYNMSSTVSKVEYGNPNASLTFGEEAERVRRPINNNIREVNKMNKLFGNLEFGKIHTSEIKFSVAGLAFLNNQGGYATYNLDKNEMTDVSGMTMDTDFVFAMPVAIKDIEKGDIIRHMGKFVVVKQLYEDGSLAAIDPVAAEEKTILPMKNIFGFNYYSKVLNLFAGVQPTGDNPFGDMSAMLPFLIMSEGSNNDALMLAMATQNTDLAANPMLMYALMNK